MLLLIDMQSSFKRIGLEYNEDESLFIDRLSIIDAELRIETLIE